MCRTKTYHIPRVQYRAAQSTVPNKLSLGKRPRHGDAGQRRAKGVFRQRLKAPQLGKPEHGKAFHEHRPLRHDDRFLQLAALSCRRQSGPPVRQAAPRKLHRKHLDRGPEARGTPPFARSVVRLDRLRTGPAKGEYRRPPAGFARINAAIGRNSSRLRIRGPRATRAARRRPARGPSRSRRRRSRPAAVRIVRTRNGGRRRH